MFDHAKQRPVKRSAYSGERGQVRPSDEKYRDPSNFILGKRDPSNFVPGKLKPMCGYAGKDESGTLAGSGSWLGKTYHKSIDKKPFSVQTVIQGIMEHQRRLSVKQIETSE